MASRHGARVPSRLAHDLAQLVTHARLELQNDPAGGRDAALRSLREAERTLLHDVAPDPTDDDATSLRSLLESAARSAVAARTSRDRRAQGVRIRVRVADDETPVADAPIVARLARNLIWNAVEASCARGRVWIEADRDGRRVRLEVRDEGRGMSDALRARLYTSGSDRARGHGVGARSVHACAALLGAEIEVETSRGRGARVCVRWAADGSRPIAAVVDAWDSRRDRLAAELSGAGWRVVGARGAEELREVLQGHRVATLVVARGTPIAGEAGALASLADAAGDCRVRWAHESSAGGPSGSPAPTKQNGHYQT